jgi:[acyl-carrier-protein] S-malonyltransferase
MSLRTLIVCPGRGSYDRTSLGQLQARSDKANQVIAACDAWRSTHGRPTVTELDAATTFQSRLHVAGENASLLTFACSLADLADLSPQHEVVGVIGNSMGFYTALAASGALSLDDAIALVDTMGAYQENNVIGGQLLYPITDEAWRPDPALIAAVDAALADGYLSIDLGSYAVLAGSEAQLKAMEARLPKIDRGTRVFPARLPLHSAFHTPLLQSASDRALAELALDWRAPRVPLIDGRGRIFRPTWADPVEIAEYTLTTQVVDTYQFATSVRTALHHLAPDRVVVLGPGNSLGAPLAAIAVQAHWRGVQDRAALDAIAAQVPLASFGVSKQRPALVADVA